MDDGKIYYNVERFGFVQKLTPVKDIIDLMPDSITAEDFREQTDDYVNYYTIDPYGYRGVNINQSFLIVDVGSIRSDIMAYLNKHSTPNKRFHWLTDMVDMTSFDDALGDRPNKRCVETLVYNIEYDGNIRSKCYCSRQDYKLALPLTEDDKHLLESKRKKREEAKRIKSIYKEGLTQEEIQDRWRSLIYMCNLCMNDMPIHASASVYSMVKTLDFLKKKRLVSYKGFNEHLKAYGRSDKKFKADVRKMYRNPEKFQFDSKHVDRRYEGNDYMEEHYTNDVWQYTLKNGNKVLDGTEPIV